MRSGNGLAPPTYRRNRTVRTLCPVNSLSPNALIRSTDLHSRLALLLPLSAGTEDWQT